MSQDTFDAKLESMLEKSVPLIYTDELKKKVNAGDHFLILDTRSPEEYQVSHIPNALFVDYDDFSVDKLSTFDKETPVVVYCSVGYRSEKIGEKLQELGFKEVHNLYGGIFDWKNKGNLVVNENGVATDSVHTYNKSWSKWLKNGIKVYD